MLAETHPPRSINLHGTAAVTGTTGSDASTLNCIENDGKLAYLKYRYCNKKVPVGYIDLVDRDILISLTI